MVATRGSVKGGSDYYKALVVIFEAHKRSKVNMIDALFKTGSGAHKWNTFMYFTKCGDMKTSVSF